MEILSTGEKIKRARVYKGITLKDLCGNKISISKMSCIENGKIKADEGILKYVAGKIGVDYNYLVQDIHDQIKTNLQQLRNNSIAEIDIEKVIKHNLTYAVEYEYYDFAFELIHRLFSFYVETGKVENIQLIISQYYDLYQKNNGARNTITYYNDMATFFMSIGEYNEAINYYDRIRATIVENDIVDKSIYAYTTYNEGLCFEKLDQIEKSYECINEAVKLIDFVNDDIDKGNIYHSYAILNIKLKKAEAKEYMDKAYLFQQNNPVALALAKGKYGKCYFAVGEVEKAINIISEGINIFPSHNKQRYVRFLNDCVNTLYINKEYDKAYDIISEALNLAIDTDDIKLIEKAYYLKGMILQKKGEYLQAELYMNLSIDALFKFGNKEKRYQRYLDMAELYYNLNETKEAIKYFTLAMNMEKNI